MQQWIPSFERFPIIKNVHQIVTILQHNFFIFAFDLN
jgi:hypothetical protein